MLNVTNCIVLLEFMFCLTYEIAEEVKPLSNDGQKLYLLTIYLTFCWNFALFAKITLKLWHGVFDMPPYRVFITLRTPMSHVYIVMILCNEVTFV